MIFVTVGTTVNDFKRLFIEIDYLVNLGLLKDVIAQIGYTNYTPKNYKYIRFLPKKEIELYIKKADFVICHGGAGTLDECLEFKKKVIIVPRRYIYNEHPDDHQIEIAEFLREANRALVVYAIEELELKIKEVKAWKPQFRTKSNKDHTIVNTIIEFIEKTAI